MRVADVYSHFNGLEYLLVQNPSLWEEVRSIIAQVDFPHASPRRPNRTSLERRTSNSSKIAADFSDRLRENNWSKPVSNRAIPEHVLEKRASLRKNEALPTPSDYNQTDFVKERVAIEVQFGKYAFVAYDLFVKHLAFYVRDEIDVGIEILPMKSLQAEMSSGPGYYEGELYNVIRNGRGVPGVPLVMIGIAP
jgi:hypothetical protein